MFYLYTHVMFVHLLPPMSAWAWEWEQPSAYLSQVDHVIQCLGYVVCQFWVLVLVSMFSQMGLGACFFSKFLLFRVISVQYCFCAYPFMQLNKVELSHKHIPYSNLREGFHQFMDFGVGNLQVLKEFDGYCVYNASYSYRDYK